MERDLESDMMILDNAISAIIKKIGLFEEGAGPPTEDVKALAQLMLAKAQLRRVRTALLIGV